MIRIKSPNPQSIVFSLFSNVRGASSFASRQILLRGSVHDYGILRPGVGRGMPNGYQTGDCPAADQCEVNFRPTIEITRRPRKIARGRDIVSPRKATEKTAAPATPMPTQTA